MSGNASPSVWDRVRGLCVGLTFCGIIWTLFSYLLPVVLSGQGWVPPGTGAWGGLALVGVGIVGLVVVVGTLRPKDASPPGSAGPGA